MGFDPSRVLLPLTLQGPANQLTLRYDQQDYFQASVDPSGNVTFSLVGTAPGFTFAQKVTFGGAVTLPSGTALASPSITGTVAGGATYNGVTLGSGPTASDTFIFNGSSVITSNPPTAGANTGWKASYFGTSYALGIAGSTLALKTGQWVSVFNSNPANNANGTTPDTNAVVSLGINGSIHATSLALAGRAAAKWDYGQGQLNGSGQATITFATSFTTVVSVQVTGVTGGVPSSAFGLGTAGPTTVAVFGPAGAFFYWFAIGT